jgi:exodeoxyribonuclease V alpha subunit
MDEHYQRLGLTTAWLQFQAARGVADGASEFRRHLRQLEMGASELNLEAGAVHLGAELAALEPGLGDERRLALIALITASLAVLQEGSTRLPAVGAQAREPMRRIMGALCGGDAFGPAGAETMINAIQALLEGGEAAHVIGRNPDDYTPLIYLRPFIYHHRVRQAELGLAQLLARRLAPVPPGDVQEKIRAAIADIVSHPAGISGTKLVLSGEQLEGVANAAAHKLSLISGGPGTGKTSIILAILRVLVRMGVAPEQIALAAPTGKAAFRMGESINEGLARIEDPAPADRILKDWRPDPATIHRLLGFSSSRRRFTYHRGNPREARAVIVDEGSMLDLSLMERLVGAIKAEARLVVLGDADQLPSVAAGAVFRDLVAAAAQAAGYPAICTRLTHSYRMDTKDPAGRAVFSLANAINSAITSGAGGPARPDGADQTGGTVPLARVGRPDDLRFEGVEMLAGARMIEPFLDRWYAARIKAADIDKLSAPAFAETEAGFDEAARAAIERIFDHMAASRVLCFTRVLSTGSERINAGLHRRRAANANVPPEREFLPGEPVIVVRNDYERMLFNGDQGVILRIRRAGSRASAMAVFRRQGKFEAFHLAALRESLELCYATTIHKAQGSEFDAVAILMPEGDIPILTREALYTGVTRARRSVVIVGPEELLRLGIARGIERFSGLGEELVRLLGGMPK